MHSSATQNEAQENLLKLVCDTYKVKIAPECLIENEFNLIINSDDHVILSCKQEIRSSVSSISVNP